MIVNGKEATAEELTEAIILRRRAEKRAEQAIETAKALEQLHIYGFQPVRIRRYKPPRLKWYQIIKKINRWLR
jgi:hypothetical protein